MNASEARTLLTETLGSLKSGYAYDIINGLLGGYSNHLRLVGKKEPYTYTDQDADSLFRTLVLDYSYDLERAERIYSAAMIIIESKVG